MMMVKDQNYSKRSVSFRNVQFHKHHLEMIHSLSQNCITSNVHITVSYKIFIHTDFQLACNNNVLSGESVGKLHTFYYVLQIILLNQSSSILRLFMRGVGQSLMRRFMMSMSGICGGKQADSELQITISSILGSELITALRLQVW